MDTIPWGVLFEKVPSAGKVAATFQPTPMGLQMNAQVKSYLYFLAFAVGTKMIVVPLAKSMNIPFVKDL